LGFTSKRSQTKRDSASQIRLPGNTDPAISGQTKPMSDSTETILGTAIAIGCARPRFAEISVDEAKTHPAATVRYVYCSGIEAWALEDFRTTLSAIKTMLQPGGVVRIATRDLDAVINGYLLDWNSAQRTGITRGEQFNAWRKSETAAYVFNEEDLRTELEIAGFADIWRLPAGASSIDIFHGCEHQGSGELVLEGQKPILAE
jgi:hypothetical protein